MSISLGARLGRSQSDSPSLSVDLLQGVLDTRLTFSRASNGTDFVGGALQTFATDVPRISPMNGLLIEEARTNSLRNSSNSGAVVSGALPTNWAVENAAGLATQVLAVGTQNGFAYTRLRIYGTATAALWQLRCESLTQIAAATGNSWSGSLFARLQAGSLANISTCNVRVGEVNSAGTALSFNEVAFTPTALWQRAICSRTFSESTASFAHMGLTLAVAVGMAVDITLEVAAPQLELGAFATSYIPTTSAAATRAADLCTMPTGAWYNSSEGTLWAEANSGYGFDALAATNPRVVRLEAGTAAFHELRRQASDGTVRAGTTTAYTNQSSLAGPAWPALAVCRMAYAYAMNDMAFSANGSTAQTDASSPDGLPVASVLRLGAVSPTSGFFNGWLRHVRYWSRRLPNDQLKASTS